MYLRVELLVQENVARFDVSMHDRRATFMKKLRK